MLQKFREIAASKNCNVNMKIVLEPLKNRESVVSQTQQGVLFKLFPEIFRGNHNVIKSFEKLVKICNEYPRRS